jgi:hypothetical protein
MHKSSSSKNQTSSANNNKAISMTALNKTMAGSAARPTNNPRPTPISTEGKWYQAFLKPTVTQNQHVSIYKSLLKPGDHVRGAAQNIQSTSTFSQFKGIEYGSLSELQSSAPTIKAAGMQFIGLDLETGLSPPNDTPIRLLLHRRHFRPLMQMDFYSSWQQTLEPFR